MAATLATLPPLWLDQQFVCSFGPLAGVVFTGLQLRLVVTNQTTGARVTLTEADATLSAGTVNGSPVADSVATFTKAAAWVRDTLTAGWLEAHLYADGYERHLAGVRRLAVTPSGGRISPP